MPLAALMQQGARRPDWLHEIKRAGHWIMGIRRLRWQTFSCAMAI
jgi:hypothetical protein